MNKLINYKFSELYTIKSGITTSAGQAGHGAPFVSFSTVFNNYYMPDELTELMDTSESQQETYSVKSGDVFLTRTSETIDELAMSCVALKDYPKATYSGFSKRLRPKTKGKVYDKFMAFFFRSSYFRRIINNHTNMTLRASFNEDIFSYIEFKLPEYEQQKQIGDLLFSLEERRRNNEKIISLLNKRIKLMYEQWFIHYDFPDDKGQGYKSNGGNFEVKKGNQKEIPIPFDNMKLGDIVVLGDEKILPSNSPDTNFYHYSIPAFDKYGTYLVEKGNEIKSDKYVVNENCILVSKLNPRFNRIIIPTESKDAISSTEFIIWKNDNKKYQNFLYALATSTDFISYCVSNAIGTSNSHKRIDPQIMMDYSFAANDHIINKFGSNISLYVDKILECKRENQSIKNTIEYLLPLFVNGQAGF